MQSTKRRSGASFERPAYTYAYDGIGNRQSSSSALSSSVALAQAGYTANNVNQYTAITQTVNSQSTTVNPLYDLNGNTTSTQGLTLTYDNENRLIEATDNTTTQEIYIYDGLGRRVETQVSSWDLSLGTWSLVSDTLFVYDGQRVVEEWSVPLASSLLPPSLLRSYTRGLDLSGSLEGAGGIGGLLAMANYAPGSSTPVSTASYFYDGNGNVIDLVGDDGSSQAHYQYSPFGETLVATGPLATVNPYQFSTKEEDAFTGFYYYGQRYYNPGTSRWLSRDPIEEQGGMNLYSFVANNVTNQTDSDGLCCYCKEHPGDCYFELIPNSDFTNKLVIRQKKVKATENLQYGYQAVLKTKSGQSTLDCGILQSAVYTEVWFNAAIPKITREATNPGESISTNGNAVTINAPNDYLPKDDTPYIEQGMFPGESNTETGFNSIIDAPHQGSKNIGNFVMHLTFKAHIWVEDESDLSADVSFDWTASLSVKDPKIIFTGILTGTNQTQNINKSYPIKIKP